MKEISLAIVGSRKDFDYSYEQAQALLDALLEKRGYAATQIVSGGAIGADKWAERYAHERGLRMKVLRPNFKKYPGNQGYYMRDRDIVDHSDYVVAFWNYFSQGTRLTLNYARKQRKVLWVVNTSHGSRR